VRDRRNTVIAALNVGMQYNKDSRTRALQLILPALQQTSAEIERAIAHQWAPQPSDAGPV
jgi:DNA-binding IclR family transcriptional regulator